MDHRNKNFSQPLKLANDVLSEIKVLAKLIAVIKKPPKPLNHEWMTGNEVVEILKISKKTLERYRAMDLISYYRCHGTCRYKYSDVMELLKKTSTDTHI